MCCTPVYTSRLRGRNVLVSGGSTVVVVGSINQDTSYEVAALPKPGETVPVSGTATGLGGKGANQAIAVARAGVAVALVGSVGDDAPGAFLRSRLAELGVGTEYLSTSTTHVSGQALVVVDETGENMILLLPGANGSVGPDDVESAAETISAASVVILQGELPAEASNAAIAVAAATNVRIVINLAPVIRLASLAHADPLVVNHVEASELLGRSIDGLTSALQAAKQLLKIAKSCVITLGADGAVFATDLESAHIPAPDTFPVVDTTGAGDAFVGVLAAALASSPNLRHAVAAAVTAASCSVKFRGAAESYPNFRMDLQT